MNNRSMPNNTVIPVLAYPDINEAIDWLCKVFNFSLRLKISDHRAQLHVFDSVIVVTKHTSELSSESHNHSIMVRVPNVDDHFTHSRTFHAKIISEPTDYPFGERQYSVEDIGGHKWTFSQSISDEIPEIWGGTSIHLI